MQTNSSHKITPQKGAIHSSRATLAIATYPSQDPVPSPASQHQGGFKAQTIVFPRETISKYQMNKNAVKPKQTITKLAKSETLATTTLTHPHCLF